MKIREKAKKKRQKQRQRKKETKDNTVHRVQSSLKFLLILMFNLCTAISLKETESDNNSLYTIHCSRKKEGGPL